MLALLGALYQSQVMSSISVAVELTLLLLLVHDCDLVTLAV
jgi:hypothetical protein